MSTKIDELTRVIADRVRRERAALALSLEDLAERSGVSKAMISKIERAETSATAVVLGKLAGAFGLTLSALLVDEAEPAGRVCRVAEQMRWTDPETGYVRTQVSPGFGGLIEVVEVSLPKGARVPFPGSSFRRVHQLIWVLSGTLRLSEGEITHRLDQGDSLALDKPVDRVFANDGETACRYAIIMSRRG